MRMTLYSLFHLVHLDTDSIAIVLIIALVHVHIQRKLSLVIVANVVDFFREQGLIADTHCVNFVVKFIFLQFGVIVSRKAVSKFSHCNI